jgi:hypothetical protein
VATFTASCPVAASSTSRISRGGVENQGVASGGPGFVHGFAGDPEHIGLAFAGEHRQAELFAQGEQLVHGRGSVDVARHEQRGSAFLVEQAGQFAGGRGFAGAVQSHQHQAAWIGREIQGGIGRAEQSDQFIVDDLDDLLTRLNALNDLLSDGLFLDSFDEITGHLEIDVGIQQGKPHFPERVGDIGLRDLAQAAQILEYGLQFAA